MVPRMSGGSWYREYFLVCVCVYTITSVLVRLLLPRRYYPLLEPIEPLYNTPIISAGVSKAVSMTGHTTDEARYNYLSNLDFLDSPQAQSEAPFGSNPQIFTCDDSQAFTQCSVQTTAATGFTLFSVQSPLLSSSICSG
jgi:hypothetical protein